MKYFNSKKQWGNYRKLKQVVKLLENSPAFKQLCKKFDEKWGSIKNALEVPAREIDSNKVRLKFYEDLAEIRCGFDLGPEWEGSILDYALYRQKLSPPFRRLEIIPEQYNNRIILALGSGTTKDEIINAWPVIEEWKKCVFGKDRRSMKKMPNLLRDEKIYCLHQQGFSYQEILDILGLALSYDDIRKACKRYEKRLKIKKNQTDNKNGHQKS